MASVTIRLQELSKQLGWEVEPLALIEWIRSQLQYLPEENAKAVEAYYTQETYEGEYFRVNEGRAALYALYRQALFGYDMISDMEIAINDYYRDWKKNKVSWALARAFYLAEYLAQVTDIHKTDELLKRCLLATEIAIDFKQWKQAYDLAVRPFLYGYVPDEYKEKLAVYQRIAQREIKHAEDYPNV